MTTKPRKRPNWKPREEWKEYVRPGNGLLKTEAEIAAAIGEEERTIRYWRHLNLIPAIVLGRKTIRYRLDAVLKALEKRTVKEVSK
jgi:hypothetical protein